MIYFTNICVQQSYKLQNKSNIFAHYKNKGTSKNPTGIFRGSLIFTFCAAAFFFFACAKEKSAGDPVPAAVKTFTVEIKKLSDDLHSFGSIMYKTKNDITCQVEGTITALNVKEGDPVTRGQQIARLRNVQLEIQKAQGENALESAKAALFMAQTRLEEARLGVESRVLSLEKNYLSLKQMELELEEARENLRGRSELHSIGGVTDSAYKTMQLQVSSKEAGLAILKKEIEMGELGLRDSDLAGAGYPHSSNSEQRRHDIIELNTRTQKAELETARANVRNAENSLLSVQKLLDELVIRATVTGVTGALYYENGEHIAQNEKIATLMDISSVYAVFSIQEQDIPSFSTGNPVRIEIPSLAETLETVIGEISPAADPSSGNFTVKAEFKNNNRVIKPGMFVKCVLPRAQTALLPAIPESALVKTDGATASVFRVVNARAVLHPIQIQSQKEGFVWLRGGLKEHDVIIDKPSPFLKEGERVINEHTLKEDERAALE